MKPSELIDSNNDSTAKKTTQKIKNSAALTALAFSLIAASTSHAQNVAQSSPAIDEKAVSIQPYPVPMPRPMPMPMPMPMHKLYAKKVPNILNVNGIAKESVSTPVANIQLAIEVMADTALAAQKEMSRRSDAVINYLRQQKVQELRTQSLSLDARYEYTDNKQKLVGYQANYTIRFQVPQQAAGLFLDESIRLGASRIDSIQFAAHAADVQKAQEKAMAGALQDAMGKADLTFKTLGLKKVAVKKINLHEASAPMVVQQFDAMPMMAKAMRAGAPTPVVGGSEMVEARVSLEVEYEDQ